LPARLTVGSWSLVHGSQRDPTWEYIVTAVAAAENMALLPSQYGLFGHTHLPIAYATAPGSGDPTGLDTLTPLAGSSLPLDDRRALVNPGSVGQPRDGDARASALVLDLAAPVVTWIRAEYDIEATQAAMHRARLPARGISRLTFGI